VPPTAAELSRRWHAALGAAREVVALLPAAEVGRVVLTSGGELFRGGPGALADALTGSGVAFHEGRIRGAFPRIVR